MDLELLSERHEKILAETGQRIQLSRQAGRTENLLWAAALAPDDAEAQTPTTTRVSSGGSQRSSSPHRNIQLRDLASGAAAPEARSVVRAGGTHHGPFGQKCF